MAITIRKIHNFILIRLESDLDQALRGALHLGGVLAYCRRWLQVVRAYLPEV